MVEVEEGGLDEPDERIADRLGGGHELRAGEPLGAEALVHVLVEEHEHGFRDPGRRVREDAHHLEDGLLGNPAARAPATQRRASMSSS